MFNIFFKKKEKEKLDCLGYYDTKPYDSFRFSLGYAKNTLILETEQVQVFARNYRGTVFVFTLVDDENGIVPEHYTYEVLKDKIIDKGVEEGKAWINIMVYQNDNEYTRDIAKKVRVNTKEEFNQVLIFNVNAVRLEYYRPVPKFYALYNHFAEAIYFDLTAIDPERD